MPKTGQEGDRTMVTIRDHLVKSAAQTFGGTNTCTSITVHETGNTSKGANAAAHGNLQANGNSREASWHYTVDDTEAVRSYPDTAQCWHAGSREGGLTSIAVEICVNADGDYDKALANASELVAYLRAKHSIHRARVYQHNHWSGKDCPTKLRASGRWDAWVATTDPTKTTSKENTAVSTPHMVSPFQGRLTAGWRGYLNHAGMDIAPPVPGQTGLPVHAAFAGTVVKSVTWAKHGNRTSTWATGRTGNGCLIRNPDGEAQGYNHMRPIVKVGQKVKAGQIIGYNDTSGNQSGPHLHFECWASARNSYSDYDPARCFRKFGVTIGSKPSVTSGGKKPTKKRLFGAIKTDGKRGPYTVKCWQTLLRKHGYYNREIDGSWGHYTVLAHQKLLRKTGFYSKSYLLDGKWGKASIKAHQSMLRKRGFYTTAYKIDGVQGPATIKATQRWLNARR
jgi:murein DD-endopeptidase MepM/ murein hydrolase activator NlpD